MYTYVTILLNKFAFVYVPTLSEVLPYGGTKFALKRRANEYCWTLSSLAISEFKMMRLTYDAEVTRGHTRRCAGHGASLVSLVCMSRSHTFPSSIFKLHVRRTRYHSLPHSTRKASFKGKVASCTMNQLQVVASILPDRPVKRKILASLGH